MKKRIAAALAFVSAAAVGGESPAMEHVLVTVPLHKKTSETALPVTVLSGEALQRAAGSTIGDTLALQPGLNSASYRQLVTAWCAQDQQQTLTALKADEEVAIDTCSPNPIAEQFQLGQAMGVLTSHIPVHFQPDTHAAQERAVIG